MILKKRGIPYEEQRIDTVYIDENRSSHFRVIRDSLRIYSTIIRYIASSLTSSIIDNLLFLLLLIIFRVEGSVLATFLCCIAARGTAALINYFINVNAVFHKERSKHALLRYMAIAIPLMFISATFVVFIGKSLDVINPYLKTLIKMVVDTILFFLSFRLQHQWVFNSGKKKSRNA